MQILKERDFMIILISGTSHTGKTLLAQKLLDKYKYPYLSIDHLKMGLIRSGYTTLTPDDDGVSLACSEGNCQNGYREPAEPYNRGLLYSF